MSLTVIGGRVVLVASLESDGSLVLFPAEIYIFFLKVPLCRSSSSSKLSDVHTNVIERADGQFILEKKEEI